MSQNKTPTHSDMSSQSPQITSTQETPPQIIPPQITVLLFAVLQQCSGKESIRLNWQANESCQTLFERLNSLYPSCIQVKNCRAAKNHAFCSWDTPVDINDEIAFIPPVSGG